MMMKEFKFFIKKDDGASSYINVMDSYDGLLYRHCTGLLDKGKPKNKYVEKFSESDGINIYETGSEVVRENTTIVLALAFKGASRHTVFENFYNYVKKGNLFYWDNVRKREAYINLASEVKPSADVMIGSEPHLLVEFEFTNIYGATTIKDYTL